MPFITCPKCGATFHLLVDNNEEWLAEHHPDAKPGEKIYGLCIDCWKQEQNTIKGNR